MNNKKLDPIETSKYVIYYLNEKSYTVNHLKLQKLLYYIEAWYSVFKNESIFDEKIEAWSHGPVIRKVWNYFKNESILYDNLKVKTSFKLDASKEQFEIINDVLDEYGDKSGYYLECLTHSETPWIVAKKSGSTTISKEIMRKFYKERLNGK